MTIVVKWKGLSGDGCGMLGTPGGSTDLAVIKTSDTNTKPSPRPYSIAANISLCPWVDTVESVF